MSKLHGARTADYQTALCGHRHNATLKWPLLFWWRHGRNSCKRCKSMIRKKQDLSLRRTARSLRPRKAAWTTSENARSAGTHSGTTALGTTDAPQAGLGCSRPSTGSWPGKS